VLYYGDAEEKLPEGAAVKKVNVTPNRFMLTTPVVLLSCWGRDSEPNIITLAWTGVLCSDPPIVYASIRPSRHSYSLLRANGDFVLNLPSAEQVEQVDLCGVVTSSRCAASAPRLRRRSTRR